MEPNEPGTVIAIDEETFPLLLQDPGQPLLVDFYATWCGHCTNLAPTIRALAAKYRDRVRVGQVDTDSCRTLTHAQGVTGLPTVIVYSRGQEVQRFEGEEPESTYRNCLDRLLKRYQNWFGQAVIPPVPPRAAPPRSKYSWTWHATTRLVILLTILLLGSYDVVACTAGGVMATISRQIWYAASEYPIVALLFGVLMGHLFWSQHELPNVRFSRLPPRTWQERGQQLFARIVFGK